MKKSELTLTGETYRLTPDNWGDSSIMVDENAISESTANVFDIDISECDPNENGKLDSVDIAIDKDGKFYALLHPYEATSWGHKTGIMHNENMYRECANPANTTFGAASLYGDTWEIFDEEED